MKYYVDIVYIMIINCVIISNDKNKNIIEMRLKNIRGYGLSNVIRFKNSKIKNNI